MITRRPSAERQLLVVAEQIAPAPARHEAAEAGPGLDQRLEEALGASDAPKPSTSSDTFDAARRRGDQRVAHPPCRDSSSHQI